MKVKFETYSNPELEFNLFLQTEPSTGPDDEDPADWWKKGD
jgi:hypothetical protein